MNSHILSLFKVHNLPHSVSVGHILLPKWRYDTQDGSLDFVSCNYNVRNYISVNNSHEIKITSFTMHFTHTGAQWIARGKQRLENSTRDHWWSYQKCMAANEAFLLGPTGNFNIRWCSTTAKPYIFTTPKKLVMARCCLPSYWEQQMYILWRFRLLKIIRTI